MRDHPGPGLARAPTGRTPHHRGPARARTSGDLVPDRVGGLPVGQVLDHLQHRDQRQPADCDHPGRPRTPNPGANSASGNSSPNRPAPSPATAAPGADKPPAPPRRPPAPAPATTAVAPTSTPHPPTAGHRGRTDRRTIMRPSAEGGRRRHAGLDHHNARPFDQQGRPDRRKHHRGQDPRYFLPQGFGVGLRAGDDQAPVVRLCRVPDYADRGGDALVSKVTGLDRSA